MDNHSESSFGTFTDYNDGLIRVAFGDTKLARDARIEQFMFSSWYLDTQLLDRTLVHPYDFRASNSDGFEEDF